MQLSLIVDLPLARKRDPQPSKLAASEIKLDGTLARQLQQTLNVVRVNPGMTAGEYESVLNFQCHKRLSDLLALGLVFKGLSRKCKITHRTAATWFPCLPLQEAA